MSFLFYLRDRKYAESKDIFTECGKLDDQDFKKDIQNGVNDPLVNITEFEDKTIDDGYGTGVEKPPTHTGTVSQAMIKRFNQHSIMVMIYLFVSDNNKDKLDICFLKNCPKLESFLISFGSPKQGSCELATDWDSINRVFQFFA